MSARSASFRSRGPGSGWEPAALAISVREHALVTHVVDSGRRPRRPVTLAAGAVYVGLAVWRIGAHRMWRDELQSWDLARSSHSIGQLLQRVRYEQHPPGWYLLLWALSRFSADPAAMQALLAGLVAVMAWVVLRFSPFPSAIRWLILFGYFPFFEYGTLSRPYVLDLILTLAGAELVRRGSSSWAVAGTVASLLVFDDAYGCVLATGLVAAAWARTGREDRRRAAGQMAVVTAGLIVLEMALVALAWRPADYSGPVLQPTRLAHLLSSSGLNALEQPARALVPVPVPQLHFWNTYLLDRLPPGWVVGLGLEAAWGLAWLLRRDRAALAMWIIGAAGTVAFMDAASQDLARFTGTIFIALLAAFWIAYPGRRRSRADGAVRVALAVVVVLQVPGGLLAGAMALSTPFSKAEEAAGAVRSLPGPVVAAPDYAATPVAGYAERPLYLAQSGRHATFTVWSRRLLCAGHACTRADYQRDALRVAAGLAPHAAVSVVLDFPATPTASLRLCRAYTGAAVPDEDYWIYAYERPCG